MGVIIKLVMHSYCAVARIKVINSSALTSKSISNFQFIFDTSIMKFSDEWIVMIHSVV